MTTEVSDMQIIGRQIRARREYLGLSIEAVAQMLNMSRVNYNRKELADIIVTGPELKRLSRILNVPVAYFFDEDNAGEAESHDLMRYYNGLPPTMKGVARQQLKALFDAQDAEAQELETTHGRKAE